MANWNKHKHHLRARVVFLTLLLVFIGLVLWALSRPLAAQTFAPGCNTGVLPSNDPVYVEDQIILTCVPPAGWNGSLVVYAHGYVRPEQPLALPEVSFDGVDAPSALMALGFAFATTSFHKNGYAVEQAGNDINALVEYFQQTYGPTAQVLMVGGSEGGLVTTMLVERYPQIYDGGLALCGPVGGANAEIQYLGDFRAVFDVFFPGIFDFGLVEGIPDDAYLYEDIYAAQIAAAFAAQPQRVDQLFEVTNVPRNPADPNSDLEAALSLLGYNVFGFNDIAGVSGGNPYGNKWRWYSGSNNDWLLNLKVERVQADPAARRYLREFYAPRGDLVRPLVTLHTTADEIVPFWHELIYGFKTALRGNSDKLTVLPVSRYGHCEFTAPEVLGSLALLVYKTGGSLSPVMESYRRSLEATIASH